MQIGFEISVCLHPSTVEVNGVLFVGFTDSIDQLHKENSAPETVFQVVWIIHRLHSEQFSVELLSAEEIVPFEKSSV